MTSINTRTAQTNPRPNANPPQAPRASRLPKIALGLIALAFIAALLAGLNGEFLARFAQERQLIAAGKQIQAAIGAYYESSPGSAKTYPSALQHLLLDPRILGEKRHLLNLPLDPMTAKAEWGEIKNAQGEVIGAHSLATGLPTWLGRIFAPSGSGSASYTEWKFVHQP
jgi:hypothetical protein